MESTRRSGADDRTDTPDYPQIISKWNRVVLFLLIPLLASTVLYKTVMEFDSDDYPDDYLNHSITVPDYNRNVFNVLQKIGDGFLPGPEDLAYDSETSFLYTSCVDGWIKRIKLDDESLHVENWTFVGGRPLGLAFGSESDQRRLLYVANAYKGLMVVDSDGKTVNLLADEADDGVKFRLTDGVDVASDGMVYFTDASFKYNLADHVLDLIEGRPYGRLLRYDPNTKQTQVLLHDLYFANGVAISHDQTSVIFCESSLRRCSNYHIHGSRAGTVDRFITDLPGFVDNIRYDGDGRYWIAIASSVCNLVKSRNLVC